MYENALAQRFHTSSLLRFALPNVIMMVFFSLYAIVDGIFVSRLVGTLALSALNMSWPFLGAALGVGIMLAAGGSAIIAQELGEGMVEEAQQDFSFLFVASIAAGFLLLWIGLEFLEKILVVLGATPAQMPNCMGYTRIILAFSPAMFLQAFFQIFFVTAGKPGLGLSVTVAGGLTNLVLDALLMGPFQMGVEGAAIATGLGYLLPALFGTVYFTVVRSGSLCLVRCGFCWRTLFRACGCGASELVTHGAAAVTTWLLNVLCLQFWAEDGVAAMTIVMYVQFVCSAAFMGFSMGVAPVISYQYGTKDFTQLCDVVKICLRFILLGSLGMYGLSRVSIRFCLQVFTSGDSPVFEIAMEGFPLYAVGFLWMGISIFASSLFTALSRGGLAVFISSARNFFFLVGMLLLLPKLLGGMGIWLAVSVAEALGAVVAVRCLIRAHAQGFPQC